MITLFYLVSITKWKGVFYGQLCTMCHLGTVSVIFLQRPQWKDLQDKMPITLRLYEN